MLNIIPVSVAKGSQTHKGTSPPKEPTLMPRVQKDTGVLTSVFFCL